jgi:hypothetical protein
MLLKATKDNQKFLKSIKTTKTYQQLPKLTKNRLNTSTVSYPGSSTITPNNHPPSVRSPNKINSNDGKISCKEMQKKLLMHSVNNTPGPCCPVATAEDNIFAMPHVLIMSKRLQFL